MAYFISQGMNLKMGTMPNSAVATYVMGYFNAHEEFKNVFPNLQEIGEISFAGAGGSYDQIEVTTLADTRHVYTDGLIADDSSASNEIAFKFLYEPELFKLFKDMMSAEENEKVEGHNEWIVSIPEGGTFTISGDMSSLKLDSVSVNSALTFTLAVAVKEVKVA
jgi:hypothetical protein